MEHIKSKRKDGTSKNPKNEMRQWSNVVYELLQLESGDFHHVKCSNLRVVS